ncbi:unnamed protein product [Discula destructiva]
MTPPQTAGLSSTAEAAESRTNVLDFGTLGVSQQWSSEMRSTPTNVSLLSTLLDERHTSRPRLRRALSESTIHDSSVARESAGAFKILITKPGEELRSSTVEDIDDMAPHLLDVTIPSGKLGTPRWSTKGTPLIRGSSYAPTEEFRVSHPSPRFPSTVAPPRPGSTTQTLTDARISTQKPGFSGSAGPSQEHALRMTYMSARLVIEPSMFDALTFKPACDDRALVRYSVNGAVTAATPPRLVAEITSPTFLDYELLSDFFLTYRSYLAPLDLLKLLFARMRWSLAKTDELGTVVRVRTFVAIRHWILNYFVDDFVVEYDMRTNFCDLMNTMSEEMSRCPNSQRVQLKILVELKKCWRRVCAQFWDGSDFDTDRSSDDPISPGGIPGHRNPSLDPDFWKQLVYDGPPRLSQVYAPLTSNPPETETSFYRELAEIGAGARAEAGETGDEPAYRPGTPKNGVDEKNHQFQLSPTSISSAEAFSCSFPVKLSNQRSRQLLGPHPVDPSTISAIPQPVAATPRTLQGKRVRAELAHRRNKSAADSMRENKTTLEKMLRQNTDTILELPYAGSLVRGNVLPPGQAFVEVLAPGNANASSRQTTYLRLETDKASKERVSPSAMSGQGMRRLIGSVRRVLSTRGQQMSPTQGNFNISPIGPRGVTANRLPGTALVPQSRSRANITRPPVRIDLLGAQVVEDFKKVVREDAAEAAAAQSFHGSIPSTPTTIRVPEKAELNRSRNDLHYTPKTHVDRRPFSEGGVTVGSKSILIFDDTLRPTELYNMAGALGASTVSVEVFADSFIPSGAEPSPPNTPEGGNADTPRRSSYLLGQHVLRPVRSADDLPPFIPDLDSLRGGTNPRAFTHLERPTVHPQRRSSDATRHSVAKLPPVDFQRRSALYRSGRSFASNGTNGLRRRASYHSGMGRRSAVRSLDATTWSYRSSRADSPPGKVPLPQPLRVLRRRPGGDLKAVRNVVELRHAELRKSRSLGSLTTGTYASSFGTSLILSSAKPKDSSGLVEVVNSDYSRGRGGVLSLGAMAEPPKQRFSLLSTFASRPVMRPSFEAEAQKLANIPDDDDDGGVESALLKLEGKYVDRKLARISLEPDISALKPARKLVRPLVLAPVETPQVTAQTKKHRHERTVDDGLAPYSPLSVVDSPPVPSSRSSYVVGELARPSSRPRVRVDVQSVASGSTAHSYGSIPLLQRELTDDGLQSSQGWANQSIFQDDDCDDDDDDEGSSDAEDRSDRVTYDSVSKSASTEKTQPGDIMPTRKRRHTRASQISHGSYLNMEDTDDDELSSELSDIPIEDDDEDEMMAFPTLRPNASLTKIRISSGQTPPVHSESQTFAVTQSKGLSEVQTPFEYHDAREYETKPLPPTPDYMHTYGQAVSSNGAAMQNAANTAEDDATARKYSAHLPFVLAFESEILAQQFTLIEKDALDEIDWKELIDMRWKNAENNDSRSWVHFLRDTDARGVEVVIARFNIVVKWAISEIVLTQDMEERARTIIKYIHIALHCRRYRNFATMSQIAVALTSGEIGRLTQTWRLVPATDLRTFRELETLISPTRNFYALRAEMEGYGAGAGLASTGVGCIPFVGIYTHDLIFNSQRPGEIASSPTTAPLVNFERCRIAAGIVKALLRLLEASNLYNFQPIEGITERCLWMSALSDEEIRLHSSSLE